MHNIVLITVDSLRADHLGCYGYGRPTSPRLDQFATESSRFTHAFSAGPNTPHAFPAIMAARSPLVSRRLGLFDAPVTLPEVLQSAGYMTIGFNAANPYVSGFFRYNRGFDEFQDYVDFTVATNGSKETSSLITIPELDIHHYAVSEDSICGKASLENTLNSDIFESIRKVALPFFLWIHYMDSHYPYVPQRVSQLDLGIEPVQKDENFNLNTRVRENLTLYPQQLHRVVDLYDASIRQVDSKIGHLFSFLKEHNLYDETLIMVTADHGEEFLDHGDLQHKSKLYDELVRVPLFMKSPNQNQGVVREEVVSLIQLPATILSRVGIESPFQRQSISKNVELNSHVFAEASCGQNDTTPVDKNMFNINGLPKRFCLRTGQWKLIQDQNKPKPLLFNLIDDPFEEENIFDGEPKQANLMQETLVSHINNLEQSRLREQISRIRKKCLPNLSYPHALRTPS